MFTLIVIIGVIVGLFSLASFAVRYPFTGLAFAFFCFALVYFTSTM